MKKILITGAGGFIGRNLINCFLSKGYQIYALDYRFPEEISSDNVICITCDLLNLNDTISKINNKNFDCFIHLAWGATSGKDRGNYVKQLKNIEMTCKCVELSSHLNCKRFIYASSINELETYEYLMTDGATPSLSYIYGTGKLAAHFMAESVAVSYNLEFIPVLITNIFGDGENSARLINSSIRKMLKGQHCSFTSGTQNYDFIFIEDAINSIAAVALNGKAYHCYYIGNGQPMPLKDYLMQMRDIVSPHASIGLGEIDFHGVSLDYSKFDLKKVQRDTGYRNKYTFKEGILKTKTYIEKELSNE